MASVSQLSFSDGKDFLVQTICCFFAAQVYSFKINILILTPINRLPSILQVPIVLIAPVVTGVGRLSISSCKVFLVEKICCFSSSLEFFKLNQFFYSPWSATIDLTCSDIPIAPVLAGVGWLSISAGKVFFL